MEERECLFCKIIAGKVPTKKVFEDENALAFLDVNPRNPGHTLVVPKKHVETIFDISNEDAATLFKFVKKIAEMVKNGMNAQGLSISQSNGKAAGQIINHLCFHVIPRYMTEGPIALEGVLPVKRMDEASLDKIVGMIKEGKPETKKEKKSEKEKEEDIDFDLDL